MKTAETKIRALTYSKTAPYKQSDPTPIKVDVTISQSLSRPATIEVTDYLLDWEDYKIDEDGKTTPIGTPDYDFSECDLVEAYKSQEYTIPDLLNILSSLLDKEIKNAENASEKKRLNKILACCKEWIVDETEVVY